MWVFFLFHYTPGRTFPRFSEYFYVYQDSFSLQRLFVWPYLLKQRWIVWLTSPRSCSFQPFWQTLDECIATVSLQSGWEASHDVFLHFIIGAVTWYFCCKKLFFFLNWHVKNQKNPPHWLVFSPLTYGTKRGRGLDFERTRLSWGAESKSF